MMKSLEKHLNALQVVIISAVLFGAFAIQIFLHERPCPLCFLQRLGMLGVAIGALMNIKFGPHKRYYAFSIFAAFFGGFVGLRQFLSHACPGSPTFSTSFWGLSLYTWSFIVFVSSVLFAALMLVFFDQKKAAGHLNWWHKSAFLTLFVAAVGNIGASLLICGLGPCEF